MRLRCGIEKLWNDRLEEVTAHAPGCGVLVSVARGSVGNVGERLHVLGPIAHVIVDEQNVEVVDEVDVDSPQPPRAMPRR